MPFMQRLTWGGVALHAGHLPGYPASHGCIRMPMAFARKLFAMTSLGALVAVVDGGPDLPRVEMASAAPPPRAVPATPAARIMYASATLDRPPPATWQQKSADDYVTWGSALPGHSASAGGVQ